MEPVTTDQTQAAIDHFASHGLRLYGDAATDPDSRDFAMFTNNGNSAVAFLVRKVRGRLEDPQFSDNDLVDMLRKGRKAIAVEGHTEVGDTMVRETIFVALEEAVLSRFGSTDALERGLT